MLIDAEPVIVIGHTRGRLPQAFEHRARARRQQRAGPRHFGRIAGKVDIDVKALVVELQFRFARRQAPVDAVKGIARHEMSIAIDDHRYLPK